MKTWIPERDLYLDELLRREGRGGFDAEKCAGCIEEGNECVAGSATYRCLGCSPGPLLCGGCVLRRHEKLPFHRIEVCACFFCYPSSPLSALRAVHALSL